MATVDSTTTVAGLATVYLDNLSYSTDGSVAKARAFIEACRALLLRRPQRAQVGTEEIEFDMRIIQAELLRAEAWLNSAAGADVGGAGAVHFDCQDFRE